MPRAVVSSPRRDDPQASEEIAMIKRKPATRILIADDHRLLADVCKEALEPQFQVVGVVTDGRALVKRASVLKPDVVILDISMPPHMNGLDAGQQVKRALPKVKLIFLTMSLSAEVAAEAFRRGASAYVTKHSGLDELIDAVCKVVRGESYLSPMIAEDTVTYLLAKRGKTRPKGVTPRQSQVLQLLVEGRTMKEVASVLDISAATVAFHKYRMMGTLGTRTNTELLSYALKHDLITKESIA
jgi:DNA-binding NarL/FixJ family response regulator